LFYKYGKIRFTYQTESLYADQFPAKYDTSNIRAFSGDMEGSSLPISNYSQLNNPDRITDTFSILHLTRALQVKSDSFLPMEFRNEIISQWTRVKQALELMKIDVDNTESFMLIQRPCLLIPSHNHPNTPTVLTFCFSYESSNPTGFQKQSKQELVVSSKHTPNNTISYEYPDNYEPTYFTFTDEMWHSSYTNHWKFFWVYDLTTPVEVPKSLPGWQYLDIKA
jgi:hypothetical protein